MNRSPDECGRAASGVRISLLVGSAIAAAAFLLNGTTGASYASDPSSTAAPDPTTSSVAPSVSTTVPTSTGASPTPTGNPTHSSPVATDSDPAPSAPAGSRSASPADGSATPKRGSTTRTHETAPRTAAQPNTATVAASPYLTLTASSLDASGLTYVGTFPVSRPSGSVQVLRFTLTSGALADLSLTQGCAANATTTVTTAGSASLGGATFDAVSLAVTIGGTPLTFTVADPPTTAFPSEIVLQDITLIATTVSADTLSAPSLTTQAATC